MQSNTQKERISRTKQRKSWHDMLSHEERKKQEKKRNENKRQIVDFA